MKKCFVAFVVSLSMLMAGFSVMAEENSIKISNAVCVDGNVEMTVTLATDGEMSGKLIAAVYDDEGRMTQLKSYDAKSDVDVEFKAGKNDKKTELFWWDSLSGLYSKCDKVEILIDKLRLKKMSEIQKNTVFYKGDKVEIDFENSYVVYCYSGTTLSTALEMENVVSKTNIDSGTIYTFEEDVTYLGCMGVDFGSKREFYYCFETGTEKPKVTPSPTPTPSPIKKMSEIQRNTVFYKGDKVEIDFENSYVIYCYSETTLYAALEMENIVSKTNIDSGTIYTFEEDVTYLGCMGVDLEGKKEFYYCFETGTEKPNVTPTPSPTPEPVPANKIEASLNKHTDEVLLEVRDGLLYADCSGKENIPANLYMEVCVIPPSNAVKYYAGTDASVVAAYNDAEGFVEVGEFGVGKIFDVTDENGCVIPFTYPNYYKWIDADGKTIAVQELIVRIEDGLVRTMDYTVNVDCGIGKFEAYLVDTQGDAEDYVANVYRYLDGKATDGYTLYSDVSFDGYRVDYDFSAYDTLKLVFTPFDGEEFSTSDVVEATGEYYDGNDWNENWNGTYDIVGENLIITYPFNTELMADEYADAYITVNGRNQDICVNWDEGGYGQVEQETIEVETWAEAVYVMNNVSTAKEYYIDCRERKAITLTGALTIPANVDIRLYETPSFTVANGATLTLTDDRDMSCSSSLRVTRGDFIVENGGTVTTTYRGTNDGTRYYPSLSGVNITFKSGAALNIPEDALLSINPSYYYVDGEAELSVLTFEEGSTVTNNGNLNVGDFDTVNVNGTVNLTNYTSFYGYEINISGNISVEPEDWGYFEICGTVNIGENASVVLDNTNGRSNAGLRIYGPLTNKGNIEIKGSDAVAEIMNNGFVNYNEGRIYVADGCSIYTSGTKFINTGTISGDGVLNARLGDDYTNYDDGTEYIDMDNDGEWDEELDRWVYYITDYPRYKYTHDPSPIVDVILYLAEVVNMGSGECTLNIEAESFPEL